MVYKQLQILSEVIPVQNVKFFFFFFFFPYRDIKKEEEQNQETWSVSSLVPIGKTD